MCQICAKHPVTFWYLLVKSGIYTEDERLLTVDIEAIYAYLKQNADFQNWNPGVSTSLRFMLVYEAKAVSLKLVRA
ncbi:hypothetical protein BMS3Bbin04_00377 [bacterium BMS3Bbin04]|nr:hypothetical protein BMS3Bbin04_00377 [bacterium BMS3Bbin04]